MSHSPKILGERSHFSTPVKNEKKAVFYAFSARCQKALLLVQRLVLAYVSRRRLMSTILVTPINVHFHTTTGSEESRKFVFEFLSCLKVMKTGEVEGRDHSFNIVS